MGKMVERSAFDSLINEIERNKRATLREWGCGCLPPVAYGYGGDGYGDVESLFIDTVGVIPVYSFYQAYWKDGGSESPFNVSWFDFNVDIIGHHHYLLDVIPVLQEQLCWWSVDEETRSSHLFRFFEDFVSSITQLGFYLLGEVEERVRALEVDLMIMEGLEDEEGVEVTRIW